MTGKKLSAKYDTVIWDWNGTLLNDIWLCVEIVNKILMNHNTNQLNEAQYREAFGFPITDYYQRIGIDLEKESFQVLTEKFISGYESKVRNCELHVGVKHVLEKFSENALQQFILTAAHKKSVLELLDYYSIAHFFNDVEGLDNHRAESKVWRGKLLVEENQINRDRTILIGDTIHDAEVAKEIGVDCMIIANGHQSKRRLKNHTSKQTVLLNRIEELLL